MFTFSLDLPKLDAVIRASESYETDVYFRTVKKLYADVEVQSFELFDIAYRLTNGFREITPEVLLLDSRIIKVLRYCTVPVVSQMKLGQQIGVNSSEIFEKTMVSHGETLKKLQQAAPLICEFFTQFLDAERFIWLRQKLSPTSLKLAVEYSKKWTASLISNQNSETAFRNWRKELQETSAVQAIVESGYTSVDTRRTITEIGDLLPGQFSRECRVRGANVQKADLAVRLKTSGRLLLVEAKAIGVRIDSIKRIKECRSKFSEWIMRFGNQCVCAALLSGFVQRSEVESAVNAGAMVFWEHDLADFRRLICEG